jgi:hypothetical protein
VDSGEIGPRRQVFGRRGTATSGCVIVAAGPPGLAGHHPADRTAVNVGTLPLSPTPYGAGKAQRPLMAAGGGGAFVVVRAGESPVHGEGRQRACGARLEGGEVAGERRRAVACAERGAGAGTRDPAQAAQVGSGRSGPQVLGPAQPRLRPGHADGGVDAGQGQPRVTLSGRGRPVGRLRRAGAGRAAVPHRASRGASVGELPAVAGQGAQDPQARRHAASPGDRDGPRPGRSGRSQAGAGADLRGRLCAVLVRVSAGPPGSRRDRRGALLHDPLLRVDRGSRHRGVLGAIVTLPPRSWCWGRRGFRRREP